jgi:GNAT superfamily N-acetyltransferase
MIRAFEERDAEGVAALLRDGPWLATPESLVHRARTLPARARARRWVAEEEGAIVGWAQIEFRWTTERDDVAEFWSFVRPDRRGAGIGSRLYELAAAHVIEHGARELGSGAWEEAGHRFLLRRGYERTREARLSALDPRAVDTSGLALPEGFRLVALADLRGRERDLHALYMEAAVDVPAVDAPTNIGCDEWVEGWLGDPHLSHDGSFVVLDGDRPVAFAWIKVAGRRAQNELTGTAREYRRRGLARAAKLATIRWCAEHGIERIATGNDSSRTQPARAHSRMLVAEEEGAIIGWAQTKFKWATERDDIAEVWAIVRPDRRAAGIGSQLYDLAASHAADHGARELESGTSEEDGRLFLSRLGYQQTREAKFSALDPRTTR